MLVADRRCVGVVVERDIIRAPEQDDLSHCGEHEADGRPQALRPAFRAPSGEPDQSSASISALIVPSRAEKRETAPSGDGAAAGPSPVRALPPTQIPFKPSGAGFNRWAGVSFLPTPLPRRRREAEQAALAEVEQGPLDHRGLGQHQRDRLVFVEADFVAVRQLAEGGAGAIQQFLPAKLGGPAAQPRRVDARNLVVVEIIGERPARRAMPAPS